MVAGQTGTGRDQLTEDDVLLQTHQGVRAAVHGGLSEHASGFLEGGGRQPRVGSQGGLGDTHQFGTARGRLTALSHSLARLLAEGHHIHKVTLQQLGVTRVKHGYAAQHLAHNNLNVLGVDVHTLVAVHLLDFIHQVTLGGRNRTQTQHLLGVNRTLSHGLTRVNVVAFLHQQLGAARNRNHQVLFGVVTLNDQALTVDVVLNSQAASSLSHHGLTLRRTGFEKLLHTR